MALNAYLRITGQKQGNIKGSVRMPGREDSITVIAYEHEVTSPRDAASGLPTGKRQHHALTITKEIDRATPQLMNMLVSNENITQWELCFYQPSKIGKEQQFYTIRLTDASISGIRQEMLNNKYPENMQHKEREHVSFCYRKIEWVYVDGAVSAQDDWEAPVV